jgi:predicted nucleic acid-binding protein
LILPDTSIWIDHLHAGDPELASLLANERVITHPFVIGEIMLGSLRARGAVRAFFEDLRPAVTAENHEVLDLIERRGLFASGIGYVDAHLLASVQLTRGAKLWTRDKRLATVAGTLGLTHSLPN